jgi:hypothetical protein
MWKKIAVSAAIGAAVLGGGGAALAASGGTSGTPSPSASGTNGPAKHPVANALARAVTAQWVTRDRKSGGFVTHDAIRGVVEDVSSSTIKVKAADGTEQTYAVTPATKVRVRTNGKGQAGTISDVHNLDRVEVVGTGTTSLSAAHILDVHKDATTPAPSGSPTS